MLPKTMPGLQAAATQEQDRQLEYEACRRLWLAVLTQAAQEAKAGRAAARAWIEYDVDGDFTAVCELADVDPDMMREGLRRSA